MAVYPTTWFDYRLPEGHEFAVAVCGYSGKIRHMTIGTDTVRHWLFSEVKVEKDKCQASEHCLAMSCPLNKTEPEHLAHMLDMRIDEPLDSANSELWKTGSTVDALVKFADKMNEAIPEEMRKRQEPIKKQQDGE